MRIFCKAYDFFFILLKLFCVLFNNPLKIVLVLSKGPKRLSREAQFGEKLIYWSVELKNDHNSSKFLGIAKSLMALVLSTNGAIPDLESEPFYLFFDKTYF